MCTVPAFTPYKSPIQAFSVTKPSLAPPSGSRDFLPQEALFRERVFATVKSVFTAHGYAPFETPAFERLETLSGKYGEEGEKLIFKILKRGEKAATGEADLALRYDLTVPAMRLYAHRRNDLPRVVRRYQIGPVWRADRPGRGRFREFYQCDVDVFGSASPLADVDVLLALSRVLEVLGLKGFTIRLNSRQALRGLMSACGVPPVKHQAALIALDKYDKIGVDGVSAELRASDLPQRATKSLLSDLKSNNPEAALRARIESDDEGKAGLLAADNIASRVAPLLQGGMIRVDPILARGLDYYTGPIFEFIADDGADSIAGGGRYDDLASLFMKESVPVCGGSLGIERIIMLLQDQVGFEPAVGAVCYVTVWDEVDQGDALQLVAALRAEGVSAEVDLSGGKLSRQLKVADERGCRVVIVQGPDEKAAGEVTIKEMESGNQRRATKANAPSVVKELIK